MLGLTALTELDARGNQLRAVPPVLRGMLGCQIRGVRE